MSFKSLLTTFIIQGINRPVDGLRVGSGGDPNAGGSTITSFTASASIPNPNVPFLGALSGFAYYSGTPGVSAGSIQGGAVESYAAMTGDWTAVSVLGFEGIGTAVGTGHTSQVVGIQASARASDTVTVDRLIAFLGRAPHSAFGTPTVTDAYTVKLQEPTIGTNRYTQYSVGRSRFAKGDAANVLEICASGDLLQWGSDGRKITGYASDGASTRLIFDPQDAASSRILSSMFSAGKHITLLSGGNEVFAVDKEGYIKFSDSLKQTTVGAAGAASALPAAPTAFFKVMNAAGTVLVIPAYAAS